jgi:hypothetical protein
VPTGRFTGHILKIHILLPVVTLAISITCVYKTVRSALQNAAQKRMARATGVCKNGRRKLCFCVRRWRNII